MSKQPSRQRNFSSLLVVSFCVFLGISISLNVWFLLQGSMLSWEPSSPKPLSYSPKCLENGFLKKEDFLSHYRVGKDETLQSIARVQLHDQSRAHEIYILNSNQLVRANSSEESFLPQNMVLLVPPVEARFSSANVVGVEGKIIKLKDSMFLVSPKAGLTISLYTDVRTKLERNFQVGNCIEAIYYGDNSNLAVWISPQT